MRHLPYEERLQRLGLQSLQRRRLRDDFITAFKIFKGLLYIDPNSVFLPPAGRGLRGHPFKVLQCTSHHRGRGSAFSVGVVKYWNKLPASVVTAPCVNVFREKVGESLDRSLSPSPPLTEPSSPHFLNLPSPSHLHTTHWQLSSLYVTQLPVLYMWFLKAHRCLLFIIINQNHKQNWQSSSNVLLGRGFKKPFNEFLWILRRHWKSS